MHIDGARIANATAALGGDVAALRAMTVDAGVDVLTFGGTKNGLLGGEAVVFLRPELARRAVYLRKQVTQLPSKMRFVAAQFLALLDDDLLAASWPPTPTRWPPRLHAAVAGARRASTSGCPAVNSLFPMLPAELIEPLRDVVLLLGLGRRPPPGALDDGVGHHRGRRRSPSPRA